MLVTSNFSFSHNVFHTYNIISPFPEVFSTYLENFLPFSSKLKLSSANSSTLEIDLSAELHSSVGSVADLRIGGCLFDPQLGQYSFPGLMIVIATGFIPLSSLSIVSTMVMRESSQ